MIASTQTNHPLVSIPSKVADRGLIDQACARLRTAGLRITQPRIAILGALIRSGQPTSIEQLHADTGVGACDLVTVYRCLVAFEEIGLVRRSFFHNGTSLFVANLEGEQRYHVLCKETNHVEELDPATTADLRRCAEHLEGVLRARGYTGVTHVTEFFGVAPKGGRVAAAHATR